jgi:hypothetical protein
MGLNTLLPASLEHVVKTFKDESFRTYVPPPLPADPPLSLQPEPIQRRRGQ